jgi:hypothetical protein
MTGEEPAWEGYLAAVVLIRCQKNRTRFCINFETNIDSDHDIEIGIGQRINLTLDRLLFKDVSQR